MDIITTKKKSTHFFVDFQNILTRFGIMDTYSSKSKYIEAVTFIKMFGV